jgi:DNA-binding NtrC family response regulator
MRMQDKAMIGQPGNGTTDLKRLLEAYERSLILEALAAHHGHQRRAAARLGILPTTLHEKMKRLGLLRPRPRPVGALDEEESMTRPSFLALGRDRPQA